MRYSFLILILIWFYKPVFAQHDHSQHQSGTQKVIYTCPMHPEIQMSKPGNCPKCGMTLVKKTMKTSKPKTKIKQSPKKETVKSPKDSLTQPYNTSEKNASVKDSATIETAEEFAQKINLQPGKTVRYDLYVTDTIVNFTGKEKHAIAINGSIPSPTLVFTEGDTAEIFLHNKLKNEATSLHWHGVILPNRYDGVPFLTTEEIGPGETHLYKFPIVQNGTYWYHSHTSLQEQKGMYGVLIFNKKAHADSTQNPYIHNSKNALYNKEYTVILSEWADENPTQIQRRLRTGNDWFSIKKGSTQSYAEAMREGYFKTKFINEWKRMKAMDVSDVYYQEFLINGKPETSATNFKACEKVKLQIVNGGASSYFWLQYAGSKITVIGNDGNDVQPVEVDRLIIAPAETYDIVVTIPENMSYELRATPEDRTGATSLWLGNGMKMPAPVLPRLKYFAGMQMMNSMMKTNGQMVGMGMKMSLQKMDMNAVMYEELRTSENEQTQDHTKDTMQEMEGMHISTGSEMLTLNYDMLRAAQKTYLPDSNTRTMHFTLTGNMNRYVWTLDNKTINEADRILIKQGEVIRMILTNNSMMRHPMHLHGHDFRVINSQGDYAPLKNVIDIMPMETDTIEFAANQTGDWFFHCHILYHMMAGMGRVFTYENSPKNPELPDSAKAYRQFKRDNNMYHLMVRAGIESNGSDGEAMFSTNRYALQQMWHLGYHDLHGYESETNFGRYFGVNQWWFAYAGFDYHYKKLNNQDHTNEKNMFGQLSNKNNRHTIVVGAQYTLPWLILADARIDGDGKFRFQLSREDVPVTSRLRLNFMGNTDKEYMLGFRYIVSKWFALSTHYDSDMGLGAGITLTY